MLQQTASLDAFQNVFCPLRIWRFAAAESLFVVFLYRQSRLYDKQIVSIQVQRAFTTLAAVYISALVAADEGGHLARSFIMASAYSEAHLALRSVHVS